MEGRQSPLPSFGFAGAGNESFRMEWPPNHEQETVCNEPENASCISMAMGDHGNCPAGSGGTLRPDATAVPLAFPDPDGHTYRHRDPLSNPLPDAHAHTDPFPQRMAGAGSIGYAGWGI